MDYDNASYFEINKAVAKALGNYYCDGENGNSGIMCDEGDIVERDFCGEPNDAYSIIIENKISIVWTGSYWVAMAPMSHSLSTCQSNTTPLRCAMIVFLKMQDKPE